MINSIGVKMKLLFLYITLSSQIFAQSQQDSSKFNLHIDSVNVSFNRRTIPSELKNSINSLINAPVVYFKRWSYGSVLNYPVRNVLLSFSHGNDYVVYYKFTTSRYSEHRVILFDHTFHLKWTGSFCDYVIPKTPEQLIERILHCSRPIQEL